MFQQSLCQFSISSCKPANMDSKESMVSSQKDTSRILVFALQVIPLDDAPRRLLPHDFPAACLHAEATFARNVCGLTCTSLHL